ncbi:MAG: hypothetical protein ACI4OR_01100 [Alphaproteobacteria bacterium]
MKKQNLKKQIVVSQLMGNPAENKALNTAGCPIRSGMTECAESGRSMVEMLGVLAIIGVLSVSGVAVYTAAINKHRANELLNEASKRAAIVAMQITAGKTGDDLSIAEFTNPSGYVFGVASGYKAGDKTFSLTLAKNGGGKIDKAICAQMKVALGDNGTMAINNTCAKIAFNTDMSNEVNTDVSNADKGSECTKTCEGGASCTNGYCECPDGKVWNPTGRGTSTGEGTCNAIEGDCATNFDCEKNQYCAIDEQDKTGSLIPLKGTCTSIGIPEKKTYNDKIFLTTKDRISYWSARNWCLAQGKSMASLADLGITGGYEPDLCKGTDCICGNTSCTETFWNNLSSVFGAWLWMADNYSARGSYVVNPTSKIVNHYGSRSNFNYAVCK